MKNEILKVFLVNVRQNHEPTLLYEGVDSIFGSLKYLCVWIYIRISILLKKKKTNMKNEILKVFLVNVRQNHEPNGRRNHEEWDFKSVTWHQRK